MLLRMSKKSPAAFVADLHIHSHFSRATSPACTLEGLHHWAQLKGVTVVGTGDFTHPKWFAELREKYCTLSENTGASISNHKRHPRLHLNFGWL